MHAQSTEKLPLFLEIMALLFMGVYTLSCIISPFSEDLPKLKTWRDYLCR